jgi:hypothetical protein
MVCGCVENGERRVRAHGERAAVFALFCHMSRLRVGFSNLARYKNASWPLHYQRPISIPG